MKFVLATCVRNEGPYLLEWVSFYKMLGFDEIIIFSNDNDDGSDKLLSALQEEGLIQWRPRVLAPGESPQSTAFHQLSKELFDNSNYHGSYLAWFDCDEFLTLKKHANIQELLAYYHFPDSLLINWKHFGSAGKQSYEHNLTISRFTRCSDDSKHNKQFKSITKIDSSLFSVIRNHRADCIINTNPVITHACASINRFCKPTSEILSGLNPKTIEHAPIYYEVAYLNHYAIRSNEEYNWKSSRGNGRLSVDALKAQFSDNYFEAHDLNEDSDLYLKEHYADKLQEKILGLPSKLLDINNEVIAGCLLKYRGVNELEKSIDEDIAVEKADKIDFQLLNYDKKMVQYFKVSNQSMNVFLAKGVLEGNILLTERDGISQLLLVGESAGYSAVLNLPSPVVQNKFKDRADAANSRFRFKVKAQDIGKKYSLIAVLNSGRVLYLAELDNKTN